MPGAVDVGLSSKGQRPEVEVALDRDLAGQLGVSAATLAQALRPAFAGLESGRWIDPDGETRDVVVRLGAERRQRRRTSRRCRSACRRPAPRAAAHHPARPDREGRGAASGPRRSSTSIGSRVVTVGANAEGMPLSAVVSGIEKRIGAIQLPPGYTRKQGGETEDQKEVFGRILIALGTAVMLMYFILVIQFGSFLDPIAIMASLPMSLIGVMLALLVTGSTLNLM